MSDRQEGWRQSEGVLQMKLRATFTSGVKTAEFETSLATVEEFLFYQYGSRVVFENLGGKMEILEESPVAVVEITAEEPPKPAKKGKKSAVEE